MGEAVSGPTTPIVDDGWHLPEESRPCQSLSRQRRRSYEWCSEHLPGRRGPECHHGECRPGGWQGLRALRAHPTCWPPDTHRRLRKGPWEFGRPVDFSDGSWAERTVQISKGKFSVLSDLIKETGKQNIEVKMEDVKIQGWEKVGLQRCVRHTQSSFLCCYFQEASEVSESAFVCPADAVAASFSSPRQPPTHASRVEQVLVGSRAPNTPCPGRLGPLSR